MTNLELSQAIGFQQNIIGQIFNDGIRDYEVLGINVNAKRFPIQYKAIGSVGKTQSISVKSFMECKMEPLLNSKLDQDQQKQQSGK